MALVNPAPGRTLTQAFNGHNVNESAGWIDPTDTKGKRSTFTAGIPNPHDHLALDYACPIGTRLLAPQKCIILAQGTIAYFANGSYDGEHYMIALIRKTASYQTVYLLTHLSGWLHKVGEKVVQGAPIVLSGDSGHTTGPHVHFEMALLPPSVNPAHYFWNRLYYRYNPALFYQGQRLAGSSLIIPNV